MQSIYGGAIQTAPLLKFIPSNMENQFYISLKIYFLAIILCSVSTQSEAGIFPKKISIDIKVEGNITLAIDIYKASNPRALIVVSPGSEGFGENIIAALNQKTESKLSKDKLIEVANEAGYSIAYYWQRGYLRTSDCLVGDSYEQRRKSFVDYCYKPNVRGKADLHTTTMDTEKIYKKLLIHPATKNLPIVSLAISEGSYHVSRLIESKKIQPIGIVFIGGLFGSLRETVEYQLRNDFYMEKIYQTFKLTGKEYISFADVVKYGKLNIFIEPPGKPPWGAALAMGQIQINKDDAAARKSYFENQFQKILAKHSILAIDTPTNGNFDGIEWPSSSSFNYLPQQLLAKTKIVDYLDQYDKKIVYLYGSFDSLIKLPNSASCPYAKLKCRIETIQGVGHVLQDESGFKPDRSLAAIINAVNEVAANN